MNAERSKVETDKEFEKWWEQEFPMGLVFHAKSAMEAAWQASRNATLKECEIWRLAHDEIYTENKERKLIIAQLEKELAEAKKTGGYTCHVCGALRKECDIMKRTRQDTLKECAEIMEAQSMNPMNMGNIYLFKIAVKDAIRAKL